MKLLGTEDLLALHGVALAEYGGGCPGVLDLGLVQAAVGRMHAGTEERQAHRSLFRKVAALVHSLVRSHPFADGNKRTGLLAAGTTLRLNGYQLAFTPDEGEEFVLAVEAGRLSLHDIRRWLTAHSRRLSGPPACGRRNAKQTGP